MAIAKNITKLAARRREVAELIKNLTDEKNELDAKLLTADPSKKYVGDGVSLSFTPVRTLDTPTIVKKYPAEKFPDFYKLALDTPEFKKNFSDRELEAFQKISYRINVTSEGGAS